MGHSYNYGLVTSAKGMTSEAIRFVCTSASTGFLTLDEDCGAGLVSGITRTAQGIYTVQLALPYPPKVVTVVPTLAVAAETTTTLQCRYKTNSYSATAGTFVFFISTAAGTAAADPATGDRVHIDMKFRRYTANA